ncbi:GTP-binding protein [Virgibacillus dokdonensis]|uniref:GTP-binding protein n=1 Tax=Virgibacillus dokdonensis TaxID=302167 RepID=A0ABU7VIY2_9BACI
MRAKGIACCATRNDLALLLSQTGPSVSVEPVSYWVASLPKEQKESTIKQNPSILNDWDQNLEIERPILYLLKLILKEEQLLGSLINAY